MLLYSNFLVGDIGGTNTRLALMNTKMKIVYKKNYLNKEIGSLSNAIRDFASSSKLRFNIACFAVAAPLNYERDRASLTNANWDIDAKELMRTHRLKKVLLLNDFEAIGLSIDSLHLSQYAELTSKGFDAKGITSIIGAGTGLGTSILYTYYGKHYPIASEGGHTDIIIDATNNIELGLNKFLKSKRQVLETESVLSGRGLVNIYEYLLTMHIKHSRKIQAEIKHAHTDDKPAIITRYALQDKDLLCLKVLELFIKFYARTSRNLVLLTLSSNLVVAGGIAPKILPIMQDMFLESFMIHDHESIRKKLENVSVLIITDPDIAFYGCANALMS